MNRTILALSLTLCTLTARAAFAGEAPKVKIAECRDGKTMYGSNPSEHRGACSGHGGVASFADGTEVKSHAKKTEYK